MRTLDHVVPPALHIMMGIAEKLYKMLLEESVGVGWRRSGLDVGEGDLDEDSNKGIELREQIREVDEEISDTKSPLEDYRSDVINNVNKKSRHEAISPGNFEENENPEWQPSVMLPNA